MKKILFAIVLIAAATAGFLTAVDILYKKVIKEMH